MVEHGRFNEMAANFQKTFSNPFFLKIISYRRPSSDQSSLALSVRPFARLSSYPTSKSSRTVNVHHLIWFNGTVPVYLSKEIIGLWYSAKIISIILFPTRIAKCSRDKTLVHVTKYHQWCNLAKGVSPNLTKGVDPSLAKPPLNFTSGLIKRGLTSLVVVHIIGTWHPSASCLLLHRVQIL